MWIDALHKEQIETNYNRVILLKLIQIILIFISKSKRLKINNATKENNT